MTEPRPPATGRNAIPQPLAAQARARPHAGALVVDGGPQASFVELAHRARAQAAQLQAAGVRAGQRVALVATADAVGIGWLHALWWLGACAVPLPVRSTAEQLQQRLVACAAERALCHGQEEPAARATLVAWAAERDAAAPAQHDAAAPVNDDRPRATSASLLDAAALPAAAPLGAAALAGSPAAAPLGAAALAGSPAARSSAAARAEPMAAPDGFGPAPRPWAFDDVVACITTSGSTGAPKPITLTVRQVLFSAFGSATRLGHLPTDTWLAVLPLHHVGGLSILWRAVLLGARVHVLPRFVAARAAQLLGDGSVQLASLVPTMLAQLLDAAPSLVASPQLRAVLLGGAPTPEPLLQRALAAKLPVAITWGMSEAASQIATRWPGEPAARAGDAGPPLPFAEVWHDAAGSLWVDGPVVQAPLRTQDVGLLDADGRVAVLGRSDDVFVSGGENVHPAPIEAWLTSHPAVAEAAVCAVPCPVWGQRPVAHLVARVGWGLPTDAELTSFCRRRLASFQLPVQFVWHDALPRDPLGKLRRRELSGNAEQA